MAAQTGSIYISGTVIDRVEIPTYYSIVFSYAMPVYIYAIMANAKTTFLLVCHSNKSADEKNKNSSGDEIAKVNFCTTTTYM